MYCQDVFLHLGPLSFIWRFILLCPLYRVSIKRGSTRMVYMQHSIEWYDSMTMTIVCSIYCTLSLYSNYSS